MVSRTAAESKKQWVPVEYRYTNHPRLDSSTDRKSTSLSAELSPFVCVQFPRIALIFQMYLSKEP